MFKFIKNIIIKAKFNKAINEFHHTSENLKFKQTNRILSKFKEAYEQVKILNDASPRFAEFLTRYLEIETIVRNQARYIEKIEEIIKFNEELNNGQYELITVNQDELKLKVIEIQKFVEELVKYKVKTNEMNEFITDSNKYVFYLTFHNLFAGVKVLNNEYDEKMNSYISNNEYIEFNNKLQSYEDVIDKFIELEGKKNKIPYFIEECKNNINRFDELNRNEHNEEFVKKEKKESKEFFKLDNGNELDDQQQTAVVTDEDYVIITAGAGSGKTATLTSKVNYLIKRKNIKPEEILLISFTRKATQEISERVKKLTNCIVDAKTFHGLGFAVCEASDNVKPDVNTESDNIVARYFEDILKYKHTEQMRNIINYIREFSEPIIIPQNFKTYDEYINTLKSYILETLQSKIRRIEHKSLAGEKMKSQQEVKIADYLFINGIEYVYESKYKHEGEYSNADEKGVIRKQYRPDFYLPEYDIYIEHFGINEKGQAPWLNEIEEQKYLEGIEWKRKIHKEFGTTMLETYSWWDLDGGLTDRLKQLLSSVGVKRREVNVAEVYNKAFIQANDRQLNGLIKLVTSFINLYKTNVDISFEDVEVQIAQKEKLIEQKFDTFIKEHQKELERERLTKKTQVKEKDDSRFTNIYSKANRINKVSLKGESSEVYDKAETDLKTVLSAAIDESRAYCANRFQLQSERALLTIIKDVFNYYQNYLAKHGEIDFNDMINYAIRDVEVPKVYFKYKYIIIDEYQDIAINRYKFYKLIAESCGAKITVVGDDWQSIYRFSGSDMNLFKDFTNIFEKAVLLKIEKTYRNSQELLNITSKFIMKNPIQIRKELKSNKKCDKPIRLYEYNNQLLANRLCDIIDEITSDFGNDKEILVLGRNNFDINMIVNSNLEVIVKDTVEQFKKLVKIEAFENYKEEYGKLFDNCIKKILFYSDKETFDILELEKVKGSFKTLLFDIVNETKMSIVASALNEKEEEIARDCISTFDYAIELLKRNNEIFYIEDSNDKNKLRQELEDKGENPKIINDEDIIIRSKINKKVRMKFLTAHKSKGTEADNVIIINNIDGLAGFPNQMEDHPILQYLLTDQDRYVFAEERRLFYVALTRTKNRVYLLYPNTNPSCFIAELTNDFGIKPEEVENQEAIDEIIPKCPSCSTGNLEIKMNRSGHQFMACSNWPICKYTLNDTSIAESPAKCYECDTGYFVKRVGFNENYGGKNEFYGCSNYPYCTATLQKVVMDKTREGGFIFNFKKFVEMEFTCSQCRGIMKLMIDKNYNLFMQCMSCQRILPIDKNIYNKFYNKFGMTQLKNKLSGMSFKK